MRRADASCSNTAASTAWRLFFAPRRQRVIGKSVRRMQRANLNKRCIGTAVRSLDGDTVTRPG